MNEPVEQRIEAVMRQAAADIGGPGFTAGDIVRAGRSTVRRRRAAVLVVVTVAAVAVAGGSAALLPLGDPGVPVVPATPTDPPVVTPGPTATPEPAPTAVPTDGIPAGELGLAVRVGNVVVQPDGTRV